MRPGTWVRFHHDWKKMVPRWFPARCGNDESMNPAKPSFLILKQDEVPLERWLVQANLNIFSVPSMELRKS